MKRLHLIRHAKSSWEDITLDDHQRPLAVRGIKAAHFMAEPIISAGCPFYSKGYSVGPVFVSSAVRAQQTIQLMGEELLSLGLIKEPLRLNTDDSLYTFDSASLLTWCRELDSLSPCLEEVVIVGHNPALEHLVEYLTAERFTRLPTCAYVQLDAEIHLWSELAKGIATMGQFLTPKSKKATQ